MAVVQATRKPLHYFLKHTVVVVTQLPLRSTLRSVDYVGRVAKQNVVRVAKQNVVLGASDVRRVPRALDKGLILAGLVVQSAESPPEKEVDGQTKSLSGRQNQGITWSSDLNL